MKYYIFTYQNGKKSKSLALYFFDETWERHSAMLPVGCRTVKLLWDGIWQYLSSKIAIAFTHWPGNLHFISKDRFWEGLKWNMCRVVAASFAVMKEWSDQQ